MRAEHASFTSKLPCQLHYRRLVCLCTAIAPSSSQSEEASQRPSTYIWNPMLIGLEKYFLAAANVEALSVAASCMSTLFVGSSEGDFASSLCFSLRRL